MCVLIEAVPNAQTFYQMLSTNNHSFYRHDLIPVLFQIYGALYKIRDEFTHYDLHCGNVLLSELTDHYFSYTFKHENTEYTFNSMYMIKIIDYGHSHCEKSQSIIDQLCRNVPKLQRKRLCDPRSYDQTELKGYQYAVKNPRTDPNEQYLVFVERNRSTDLICLDEALEVNKKMLHHAAGLLEYKNRIKYDHQFCTPEIPDGYPRSINTVSDAFYMLRDLIVRGMYRMNHVPGWKVLKITVDL